VGEPSPTFEGQSLDGTDLTLDDFSGGPLLLNVWATWCAPCRHETPFLQGLYEEFGGDGLQVLGISVDGASSGEAIREFRAEYAVTYPMIHDPDGIAMDRFFVVGLPATFLIDGEGVMRLIRLGPVDETDEELMTALEELTQ
jgi:peroxiredoxin